ncbi:hypothetical protein [Thermoanaerobacterium thermosaccharolyticum]|uniref:hypothetical protein n=1 Tax=Thermoanaerobacterium thermosaccharolyticum TaxID=1517 RepID=UPI00104900B1|nr:hypothetical protein [Thermoanaerobacterium thermosaccharolyticum]KAA5806683.1 hypothetical protein F1655_07535 [Thermoanaerobacterium thermosaccharolyticum]TCW42039.1 hypothetical protein EDC21_103206 [Thermohydrogenium kirishiense]
MLELYKRVSTKKTVALLLAMLVLLGGIISASAQTLNVQEKDKISMSVSNDTKTLNISRNGHNVLTVTRKSSFDGMVNFKDSKGKTSTVAIKVTPISNNQYDITITDEESLKTFHVTSKINPLADYLFNKNSLKIENNQQEPDALAYYLGTGKLPNVRDIVANVLGGAIGSYVQEVTNYIVKNWEDLKYLYSFYGFWAVVNAIVTAPELAGIITGAAAVGIVL